MLKESRRVITVGHQTTAQGLQPDQLQVHRTCSAGQGDVGYGPFDSLQQAWDFCKDLLQAGLIHHRRDVWINGVDETGEDHDASSWYPALSVEQHRAECALDWYEFERTRQSELVRLAAMSHGQQGLDDWQG